jgi:hypothetical protein
MSIERFQQLTSLRHLDLRETRFTDGGIARLHEALPDCMIIWDDGETIEPAEADDDPDRGDLPEPQD